MTTGTPDLRGTGRRAGLDFDEIVDVALQLVESDGVGALTMRKLAAELDVTTNTIYWHVGGRDQLVTAVIQRMSERQADIRIQGSTPRDRVMSIAMHVWDSAHTHRNVTSLAHQVGATSLLGMPLEIAMVRELDAAGLRGDQARDALRGILLCVAGFLVASLRQADTVPPQHRSQSLWAEVADDGIDPSTVAALTRPLDVASLFETTVRGVVESFVPSTSSQPRRASA